MPTLLIADDHPLFREALRGAVSRVIPGVQLYEADSVEALYQLADQHACLLYTSPSPRDS